MTTPADEIRAAATRLRIFATAATPGPWRRPLNTRYKAHVSASLPDGERGTWIGGVDPDTGQRETCTVATIPTWSNGAHARKRSGRDLEYIAAMHPGVGAVLADWLDATAVEVTAADGTEHALHADGSDFDGWNAALNVARQINGTPAPAAGLEAPHA